MNRVQKFLSGLIAMRAPASRQGRLKVSQELYFRKRGLNRMILIHCRNSLCL